MSVIALLGSSSAASTASFTVPAIVETDAEGWWNEDSLVSTTSWTNVGTAGSSLNFDTGVGNTSNFSISNTLNGITCWDSGAQSGGLRTSGAPIYISGTSVFVAHQLQSVVGWDTIIDGELTGAPANRQFIGVNGSNLYQLYNGALGTTSGSFTPDTNIRVAHLTNIPSGTCSMWISGLGDVSTDSNGSHHQGLCLAGYAGTGNYADIKIGEIILFNRIVTAQEENDIRTYLIDKWGTVS